MILIAILLMKHYHTMLFSNQYLLLAKKKTVNVADKGEINLSGKFTSC